MSETLDIARQLIREESVSPVDGHIPEPIARLTLRSENGIRLNLERRRKDS